MSGTALITGITGQDGSYLAELLLSKGYEVHGIVRRTSTPGTGRLETLMRASSDSGRKLVLHFGDMSEPLGIATLVKQIQPGEIYHLAAQTDVGASFEIPEITTETNALGTLRVLEAMRIGAPAARLFNAGSSEMFGRTAGPQNELSPFSPCSPYGYSKAYAFWATVNYRNSYGLFISNGMSFNHESERRGINFVTQKIAVSVAAIAAGAEDRLVLGDLAAVRDWGYAPEYVQAMWLALQQDEPDDYVLATGRGHTVADFCRMAFAEAGLDWRDHVSTSLDHLRPEEPSALVGDPKKADEILGWRARTTLPEIVTLMVKAARDIRRPRS